MAPLPTTNYQAWMGLPMGLQSAWDAFNKARQAKAAAEEGQMELAIKRQKLAGGGGDFNAPNYEAKLREELWSKTGGLERMKKSIASFQGMKSAVATKSDIAILYNFIKALDPESVVREGEVSLARMGIPMLDEAARKLSNALKTGQTANLLSDPLRQQMVSFATREVVSNANTYAENERRAKDVIRGYEPYGVKEERVIPGGSYLDQSMFTTDGNGAFTGVRDAPSAAQASGMTQEEIDMKRLKELQDKAAGRYP